MSAALAAAACSDAPPADDAFVYTLSSRQAVALCDDLRDALRDFVGAVDRTILCQSGETHWLLPSNAACADADLLACDVTAGELRQCLASTLRDPCASATRETSPPECERVAGCDALLPAVAPLEPPTCTPLALADLRAFEGIYELRANESSRTALCSGNLPPVIDPGASHFVLVATDVSGTAEVILQSCDSLADCQALATESRASGAPRSASPGGAPNNLLVACKEHQPFEDHLAFDYVDLEPAAPAGSECPLERWWPFVQIRGEGSALSVTISSLRALPEAPPGCYVSGPPHSSCDELRRHDAILAAPP